MITSSRVFASIGRSLLSLGSLVLLAGCGSAAVMSSPANETALPAAAEEEPAAQEHIDEIAQLEASITEQVGIMSAGELTCIDRCRSVSSICDSATRICEIARDLAELEALESCRRAETSCQDAEREVSEACTCPTL